MRSVGGGPNAAKICIVCDRLVLSGGVGLSWSVERRPLDGDLDGPRVFFQHETQGSYTIDAWYASEDGEFTLTTGDETDYESSTFEVAVGEVVLCWNCLVDHSPECALIKIV